jgi:hypothetical protein
VTLQIEEGKYHLMPPAFWLDITALSISTLLSVSLLLIALGAGPKRALNWSFSLFALLETTWAVFSLLLRLALWLEADGTLPMSEFASLAISLMGPFFLIFTVRYVDRDTRWPDWAAVLGMGAMGLLSIPLFRHQVVFNPQLDANGSTTMELSRWGIWFVDQDAPEYMLGTFGIKGQT